jgi:hypothetical protein
MKTIRISRTGFPVNGMYSWMNFFIFILSKKYNVIKDANNPDIVICSNIYFSMNDYDSCLNSYPVQYDFNDKSKKFLYVSGELADFGSNLSSDNRWAIGYELFDHPRYLRQPSGFIDIWTLFDECRLVDSPLEWLTKKRNYELIRSRNTGFCSITQASHNDTREKIFNKLSEYKQVTSSGPWKQNIDIINKYQWQNNIYTGRIDGLTYREKIAFFQKYKFNIAVHYSDTKYILQEKIIHSYFSGAIPIFYGNSNILYDKFNPDSFINFHDYIDDTDKFLDLIKEIDHNNDLYKKYIEEPIFIDNKPPEYMDFDYTLAFLEKMVES